MSFTSFLGNVGKILFGFGGAFLFALGASAMIGRGDPIIGFLLGVIAFVLALYAVYTRREL